MKRKCLAVGIILLFVGVTIAPTINFQVAKASTDDDLVEVTTHACGIKGYGNTTVKLTRDQYQNLEEYLVEFRARLNQTSTREEAVPIFKDAVVELDKYGLLPKGMSVERAQKLVTTSYDKQLRVFDSLDLDPDANYFCLVSGKTSHTQSFGGPLNLMTMWFLNYLLIHCDTLFWVLVLYLFLFYSFIFCLRSLPSTFLPFGLLSTLAFGEEIFDPRWGESWPYPSSGWVATIGVNGFKRYEGSFWGWAMLEFGIGGVLHPGALGFTGLKLGFPEIISSDTFFLGTAFFVKLTYDI